MNSFVVFIRQLGTLVLRLVALLATMVFAFSLVLAALLLVTGVSVWSLLTGRKPAPWVLYQRLRERSRSFPQPFGRAGARPSAPPFSSPFQSQPAASATASPSPRPFPRPFAGSFDRFGGTRVRPGRVTDVVDVQATEVPEAPSAGPDTGSGPSAAVPGASGAAR